MRIHAIQAGDWREYRQIRLAALQDAPGAFASTWAKEAAGADLEWRERARQAGAGESTTMVTALDDAGAWAGLAGGYRPGDRGADASLISMWVAPSHRGHGVGQQLIAAVLAWAEGHGAGTVALWANRTNRPAISLYEKAGFRPTGETGPLPSDPSQQEIRMLATLAARRPVSPQRPP